MNAGGAIWKKAPFIRLLLAWIPGILIQWYANTDLMVWLIIALASLSGIICFSFLPLFKKFRFPVLSGIPILLLFTCTGGFITWNKDVRNNDRWIGRYDTCKTWVVTLTESPVEKERSFKVNARVEYVLTNSGLVKTKGTIIIYFPKDNFPQEIKFGSRILFNKQLQPIKNQGNPGNFDYKRYALFQGITHQVYLPLQNFLILPAKHNYGLPELLESIRTVLLSSLRNNIKGEKELGLAEALLIGYKNDLDKSLLLSYSNTGVVHVIAISGLHLGLIYWLLAALLKPLNKRKAGKWLNPLLIISCLWLFSLLTGAQPSIMRSAVMFTCIVIGENLGRRTNIYNTLAFSAFVLLCYNPFWLWDIGFQLSYIAVLSIVIYMQPIYGLLYFKNKMLDMLWQMNSVTIAAQILTTPVSIYHFHQFPVLFLCTNMVAVPLSSIILLGEIGLCAISFLETPAAGLGKIIAWLIRIMNTYIEKMEDVPFAIWSMLNINLVQTILLYVFVAACSYWLMEKIKSALVFSLASLAIFLSVRCSSFNITSKQKLLIIYNIPREQAIDVFDGRAFLFRGDSALSRGSPAENLYLKPSRIIHRAKPGFRALSDPHRPLMDLNGRKILFAEKYIPAYSARLPFELDLLVISKNASFNLPQFASRNNIRHVVFDGSVSGGKTARWKKDCDSLRIKYHDVTENGAFVMSLN